MLKNQAFLNKKTWKIIVTGKICNITNVYRDKKLQKTIYRDLNLKSLRATGLDKVKTEHN